MNAKPLTIDEFKTTSDPELWLSVKGVNTTFMDCHFQVFEKHGIWIEELVPIFQKLDAELAK